MRDVFQHVATYNMFYYDYNRYINAPRKALSGTIYQLSVRAQKRNNDDYCFQLEQIKKIAYTHARNRTTAKLIYSSVPKERQYRWRGDVTIDETATAP